MKAPQLHSLQQKSYTYTIFSDEQITVNKLPVIDVNFKSTDVKDVQYRNKYMNKLN